MFRIDSAAAVTQKMPLDQRRMSYFPILLFVSNALIPYRTRKTLLAFEKKSMKAASSLPNDSTNVQL